MQPWPCRYRSRAWWGGDLVAESDACVIVDEPGGDAVLYFPLADIRTDSLLDEGSRVSHPARGTCRLWSLPGPAAASTGTASTDWNRPDSSFQDGKDVAWTVTDPAPGLEWLYGLAAFDHDRVLVELVDTEPGEDIRDVTVKRFPVWGDASHLIDMMDVRALATGLYTSVARTTPRRPVVEGSQMLGQAIVAAGRYAPGRRVVSAHMVFLRPGDARLPLEFEIDTMSDGRTFSTIAVHVLQSGRRCASGIMLLDSTAEDLIRHARPAPDVPGPYQSQPYDMSVTGRDIRVVDGAYTDDPDAPVGPAEIDAWVRFRQVPADPYIHAGLLAQFTGHMSIAAGLRPHAGIGQRQAHRTLSTAINAIGISIHGDVRADRWMLYHHESTFAGDGMTHAECRVHDEEGHLVASFVVDAMVRRFAPRATAVDDRTAL